GRPAPGRDPLGASPGGLRARNGGDGGPMARMRLGAALLLPPPLSDEINGLRRVHLLHEIHTDGHRRWVPLADAAFGDPVIIGRGVLDLELTRSQLVDPEAASILAGVPSPVADSLIGAPVVRRLVVTGRREGAVVAVGAAWMGPDGAEVTVIVDPHHRRQGIGSHVLAAVEQSVRTSDWGCRHLSALGPAGFYAARSRFSLP